MRRKTIGDGISSSSALSVESVESRGRQNNKQNNRGRSPTGGRSKSRGKSKSKGRTIVCWNCNKEGHKKNDCTEPKKKKGAGGRQGDDEGANMVSSNERTYDDLCLSATVDDNFKVWYVDSGASIHCTPHRDCFSDYVHGDYGHVTVGNRYRCSIVGKGKIEIKLSNGGTLILSDVRHIPELQKNLLSVSGLDREGYFVTFGEKQWKVTKGLMVVAREERVMLVERPGYMPSNRNLMFITLLRSVKLLLRMKHGTRNARELADFLTKLGKTNYDTTSTMELAL
ncbi:hypothetical protein RJ640_022089 [Escallonia rubra]|uniref:CCHC-type domain-containing protein n=1 Tax=Escallonia rubra TaxID=112253 RepID=A0AA88UHC1_9ASTE|nr:hypothetical protein RJ640_022089 [Escallonia rubra]